MKTFLALAILVLFAGTASAESPIYSKALPIAKITASVKGYKVAYVTSGGDAKIIYVPLEWFYPTGGYQTDDGFTKAELFLGYDQSYPYIQFFWKNGAFHHVRIYAIANKSDISWGLVNFGEDIASHFDATKPLDLKF